MRAIDSSESQYPFFFPFLLGKALVTGSLAHNNADEKKHDVAWWWLSRPEVTTTLRLSSDWPTL
jgi:hypothetical protein